MRYQRCPEALPLIFTFWPGCDHAGLLAALFATATDASSASRRALVRPEVESWQEPACGPDSLG